MIQKLTECWQQLTDFIVFRNSLDIGALEQLQNLLHQDSSLDPAIFVDQVVAFLTAVNSLSKNTPQNEADLLAILSLASIFNNLYLQSRSGQNFQPNTSTYYGWMSSSQMSIDQSNLSERQGQIGTGIVTALANSQPFFNRLKLAMERSRNQEKIKRYVQSFLDTLDCILAKQKLSHETFLKLRGKYVGLSSRRKWQVNYSRANSVIFSPYLHKIVAILAKGDHHIHSALLRIYLAWKQDDKMFESVKFSGEEMLINLYRYYVNSFKESDELFKQVNNPLFRLLKNHLALLFTPVLRDFNQRVVKIASRCGNESDYSFYKTGSSIIQKELGDFINELPAELLKLLQMLKDLTEQQHPGQQPQFALLAVKRLLFYSFLVNQSLLQQVYPKHTPKKYQLAYNHIVILFFQNSLKKYNTLPQKQLDLISQLVERLAAAIDNRIIDPQIKIDQQQILTFRIRDNILNHDYQLILEVLSCLEFTPKDSKEFQMKKIINIPPESPVYRHLRGHSFRSEEIQGQLELATWMSVGGSRDWGTRPSKPKQGRVGQRLKGFKTINLKTRFELLQESEQLRQYLKG